jgi:hypothetical protein
MVEREFFDFVAVQAAAGDVDQDIDAAAIRDYFLKDPLHVGLAGNVKPDERRLFAALLNSGSYALAAFVVDVQNDCAEIFFRETLDHRSPNPRRGAGHDCNFAHTQLLPNKFD